MAEERGMTLSEFTRGMTEAGIKADRGFDTKIQPDYDLKDQRDDLKNELDSARERIDRLERQLYNSDVQQAKKYLDENSDVTFSEIVSHIRQGTPERMAEFFELSDYQIFNTHQIHNTHEQTE